MLPKWHYAWSVIFLVFLTADSFYANDISFVAIADNRNYFEQYRAVLQEINDLTVNPEPLMPHPFFLVACGDIDPLDINMAIYNDTLAYPDLPPYYPAVGNHEFETPEDMDYILNKMIPYLTNVVNYGKQGTYSFDCGNVHCIVLDEYSTNGEGEVDKNLQAWLQQDLNATEQDHVFVFGHEPAFPRRRHVGDSLDQFRESRNAFWNILVNDPRVRAYFCGHTHYYYRMRVVDPNSVGTSGYPDQVGGVFQVDCGAAGNAAGDGKLTLVYIHVHEDSVRFRTITSPRNDINWEMTDQWVINDVKRYGMELKEPLAGSEVSGKTEIQWSFSGEPDESLTTTMYVSNDAGTHWDSLWTTETKVTTYNWNTENHPDGTRYMLRVVCKNDSGFGVVLSEGTFTINNPCNGVPEINLLTPTERDTVRGDFNIEWTAVDADGDSLLISLETSVDGGSIWLPLTSNESNDGLFSWNTLLMPNTSQCRVKLRCTDGTVWVEEVSGVFFIQNERQMLSDTIFQHISGTGGGSIIAQIVDQSQLTGHRYRITFDDTTSEGKIYDIYDVDVGNIVVDNATEMDGKTEGPLFDGIRLIMYDYVTAVVDFINTGWTAGASDLTYQISLPEIDMGTEIIRGVAYSADYQITFYNHIVDTSSSFLGVQAVPVYFTVWNLTEDHQADIIFLDNDNDHTISRLDEIYILEKDEEEQMMITWLIFFSGKDTSIPPVGGDVFTFKTLKPFTNKDVFEFYATLTDIISDGFIPAPSEFILYQNYPNPFNPITEIKFSIPRSDMVYLTIYNMLGQTITKATYDNLQVSNYTYTWNGRDMNGNIVSSGVYFYELRVGNQFSDIKKMVLMK